MRWYYREVKAMDPGARIPEFKFLFYRYANFSLGKLFDISVT